MMRPPSNAAARPSAQPPRAFGSRAPTEVGAGGCDAEAPRARRRAAAGFRAGWSRLAHLVGPKLRDLEARWWRQMRENERLRSRLGQLLTELSRLTDNG